MAKKAPPAAAPDQSAKASGAVVAEPGGAPAARSRGRTARAARGAPGAESPGQTAAGSKARAGTVSRAAAEPAKEVPAKVVTKKAEQVPAKKQAAPKARAKGERSSFLDEQRRLLLEERQTYTSTAEALKAQADSLALEHEPGDVQFDEEGGEGGTANVDREIDLYLSAQARATVADIDRALEKIADDSYGVCEQCGEPIPEARLQALPYAALCVSCKSGGLSSRR